MSLTWIAVLLGVNAVLLAVIALMARAMRRERSRAQGEVTELRGLIEGLRSEIDTLQAEVHQEPVQAAPQAVPIAPVFHPAPNLSADKRAEALEMLRSGVDSATVSARLDLSQAETVLLEKVQSMLRSESSR